jgi:hypothetical protein
MAERTERGTFQKGHKGGPGRKKGSRNNASIMLDKIMADEGEAVVKAVLKQAKGGDMPAAKLILDRIAPPRKGARIQIELPEMEAPDDISKASAAVLEAVAAGDISPDEGQAVASIVEARRRALETNEIERRLTKIEAMRE